MADYVDYGQQQEALLRRQKLLDAMFQQINATPVQGTSNGIGQMLAKVAGDYFAAQGSKKASADMAANASASHTDLLKGLNQYMDTSTGKPGTLQDEPGGLMVTSPGVQADPKRAVFEAMASQHPELKAIGAAGFKDMQPQVKEMPDGSLVQYYPNGSQPPRVIGKFGKPLSVNSQVVDVNGPAPKVTFDARDKFDPVSNVAPPTAQSPIYGQAKQGTGEIKFAPPGSNVTVNNSQETALAKSIGEHIIPTVKGAQEAAINANNAIQQGQRMMELAKDPQVITGFAAEPLQGIAALSAKLGFTDPGQATKSQELLAQQAKETLAASKTLKGAISDKEKPFLEAASAGKINWTPETIQHLAGLTIATAHNELLQANRQYVGALSADPAQGQKVGAMFPFPPVHHTLDPNLYDQPENGGLVQYRGTFGGTGAPPAPPPGVMTLDQYLQRGR